MAIINNW